MVPAVFDTVAVDLTAGRKTTAHRFRANGSVLVEPGFMARLPGRQDDKADDEDRILLPPLEEGDVVTSKAMRPEQHFTEPPPRFPRRASSRRSRSTASAARRPTPASSDAAKPRVRRDGRQALHPDRHRPHRQRLPDPALRPSTSTTTSPRGSRTTSMPSPAARRTGCRC